MHEAIGIAVHSVIDRLLTLATEDHKLRGRLRAVAREYLTATEEQPVPSAAAEPTAIAVAAPPADTKPAVIEASAVLMPAVPVFVKPSAPVVGMSPHIVERPSVSLPDVMDTELAPIESRCRLKAEGARWAATRRRRLQEGADFFTEIAPFDREIIEKAKQLPDCFLWMCHPSSPLPSDLLDWDDLAGCFAAVASGIGVIRSLFDAADDQIDRFEQAAFLLAEAQSALRAAIECVGGAPHRDQIRVYHWLKTTAFSRRFYIPRFMRIADRAEPADWPGLEERIGKLDAAIQRERGGERRMQSAFNRIRYHVKNILLNGTGDRSHDWRKVIDAVEELVGNGMPPSNRELRDLLLPVMDKIPDLTDLPQALELVLREIDRFLTTRPAPSAEVAAEPTANTKEVAALLRGKMIVLIGGDRRPYAQQALEAAFRLKELDWIATGEHESIVPFETHIARADVAVVLLAIRWSSHSYGENRSYCEKHGKPLVRLPAGYNPNQVAQQILEQCGERLRKTHRDEND